MSTKKRQYCLAWGRGMGKEDTSETMGTAGVVLCITEQPSLSLIARVSSGCVPGYSAHISPELPCGCQQKPAGCDQCAPALQQ